MLRRNCASRASGLQTQAHIGRELGSVAAPLVSPRGEVAGEADEHLAKLGLKRRIVAVVPHFLAAPLIVANSDLVTLTTKRVASYFSELLDLTIFEPPVPMGSFTIDLLASVARSTDPALQWLRDQMLQICIEDTNSIADDQ